MQGSGKKIYNARAQQRAFEYNLSCCIRENADINRARRKFEEKNSPKTILFQKSRGITQQLDLSKRMASSDLTETAKQACQNLLKLVATELNITSKSKKANGFIQQHVSFEEIEEIMNKCLPAFRKLRSICFNEEIKEYSRYLFNVYNSLFDKLIELDVRFAKFAPISSLKDRTLDIDSRIELMPKDFQDDIISLREKLESDPNLEFVLSNSPKENDERVKSVCDMLEDGVFNAKSGVAKATQDLSSNLYRFIIEQLNIQDFNEEGLKYGEIKNVLTMCQTGLNALKSSSLRKDLREIADWEKIDPYTQLYNRLININIKFAFFAPKKSLNRLDINFKKLSEKERNVMTRILMDYGLLDDDKFYENYKHIFNAKQNLKI